MANFNIVGAPISTGTTIMAVEFAGGVVIGADSRTSRGSYAVNRFTDKLTRITDHIYCCRSGSAADTQAISDLVKFSMDLLQNTTGEPAEVSAAATQFRNYCYEYRDQVIAEIIIAGWDKRLGGQVYTAPLGGMLAREPWALGGSGSMVTFGYVRDKYRAGMDKEDSVEFVKKCIEHGINLDGCSGGVIRIGVITEAGLERRLFYNTDSGEPQVNYEVDLSACCEL